MNERMLLTAIKEKTKSRELNGDQSIVRLLFTM